MDWLRLYHEVLDDPKVQGLLDKLFKFWINVMLIASRHSPRGHLPPPAQIAFILRLSIEETEGMCAQLAERGLLEREDGQLVIHGWSKRQPTQDYSTPRVQAWREKKRNAETVETAETAKRRGEEKRGEEKRSHSLAFEGAHLTVSNRQDASLAGGFPWVDLQAEYRKMDAWLEANPTKRPKSAGKFAYNWVARIGPPHGGSDGIPRKSQRAVPATPGKYDHIKPDLIVR